MTLVVVLDHKADLPREDLAALIGGKAAGLSAMINELGLPVPPAFAITTEACRSYLAGGWPDGLDGELRVAMRSIESAAGRGFGEAGNPLLVSVRSGAPVSMPGMMDTILNVGLNQATTRGLAERSGNPAFAADCRRRLVEMFTGTTGAGDVPEDPWLQLRAAVEAVFKSWNSDRARAYRGREGIPDGMGTAVTVQAMVFGNWDAESATGVMFTRNPATGEPVLYGDILFGSQGEDVVAGTHRTLPLAVLETRMPAAASELRRYADILERHLADLCDVEFTVEQGRLWLLQVRAGKRSPRAALRIAFDMAREQDFPLTRAQAVERVARYLVDPPRITTRRDAAATSLATGLAASPGVASGEIATSSSGAIAATEAGRRVILVRTETSPEDVAGMSRSAGVLTSRGGLASHAAVVARGWGIPAVVGAESVKVRDADVEVGGRVLKVGRMITIDGDTGEVFDGEVAGSTEVAPEAAILLAWARELGIPIGGGEVPEIVPDLASGEEFEVLRALLIKGTAAVDALGATQPMLNRLAAAGLVESDAGLLRLTPKGRAQANARLALDRGRWGDDRAVAALDAFLALDHRVKELVTAWQMRDVDGAPAINDHADAEYDAAVLDQLADLHREAAAWLSSLEGAPAVLSRYMARLERALTSARAGDPRFVASPRVDSYHGVWFELHEDLILLAGRNRADETAAGRA